MQWATQREALVAWLPSCYSIRSWRTRLTRSTAGKNQSRCTHTWGTGLTQSWHITTSKHSVWFHWKGGRMCTPHSGLSRCLNILEVSVALPEVTPTGLKSTWSNMRTDRQSAGSPQCHLLHRLPLTLPLYRNLSTSQNPLSVCICVQELCDKYAQLQHTKSCLYVFITLCSTWHVL